MLAISASLTTAAKAGDARPTGRAEPGRIAAVSRQVFGARWRVAACIAHYESTDGAHLFNGPNLGPWQIDADAHPWVNPGRLVTDWRYSAEVAYRLSRHGTDWLPWTTHGLCGV